MFAFGCWGKNAKKNLIIIINLEIGRATSYFSLLFHFILLQKPKLLQFTEHAKTLSSKWVQRILCDRLISIRRICASTISTRHWASQTLTFDLEYLVEQAFQRNQSRQPIWSSDIITRWKFLVQSFCESREIRSMCQKWILVAICAGVNLCG